MEENFLDYQIDEYDKLEYEEQEFENKMRLYDDIEERQSQIEELEEENKKLNLMINKMAEYIDEIDTKGHCCQGLICTVATTYYPNEERKRICTDCIKNQFRKKIK